MQFLDEAIEAGFPCPHSLITLPCHSRLWIQSQALKVQKHYPTLAGHAHILPMEVMHAVAEVSRREAH